MTRTAQPSEREMRPSAAACPSSVLLGRRPGYAKQLFNPPRAPG